VLGDIWTIAVTAGDCWPNCVEPDYVAFCLACHDGSTPPGVEMPTDMVDIAGAWFGSANEHGHDSGSDGGKGPLKRPYSDPAINPIEETPFDYAALQCTACHDQHGSPNIFHLKESITVGGVVMTTGAVTTDGVTQKSGVFDFADDPVNNRPGIQGATTYTLPEVGGSQNFLNWGAWCTFCHTMATHTGVDEQTNCNGAHQHGGSNF
jgi:predicted CXXCH cytochrome family protein